MASVNLLRDFNANIKKFFNPTYVKRQIIIKWLSGLTLKLSSLPTTT